MTGHSYVGIKFPISTKYINLNITMSALGHFFPVQSSHFLSGNKSGHKSEHKSGHKSNSYVRSLCPDIKLICLKQKMTRI